MESFYFAKNRYHQKDEVKYQFYKNGFTFLNDLLLGHYVDEDENNN